MTIPYDIAPADGLKIAGIVLAATVAILTLAASLTERAARKERARRARP